MRGKPIRNAWGRFKRSFDGGSQRSVAKNPDLVIMGLGNPGPKYSGTRHNAGFWFADCIAKLLNIEVERRHKSVRIGEGTLGDSRVVIAKPRTYMNKSGQAAEYLLDRYSINAQKLLVAYDDIHLPPGKIRLRASGSAGGHNGMRSVISSMNTQDFPRIRIGVGSQEPGDDQIGYVLGEPSSQEMLQIDAAIEQGIKAVARILDEGIDASMSEFN